MNQSPEEFKSPETETKRISPVEEFNESMIKIGREKAESYRNDPNVLAFGEITEADVTSSETGAIASAAYEIVRSLLEKASLDPEQKLMIDQILAEATSAYAVDLVDKNRKSTPNQEHLASLFK
jgi:hypothetical protein